MLEDDVNIREILEFYVRAGVDETCGSDVFFQSDNQKKINDIKNIERKPVNLSHSYLAFDTQSAVDKAYELSEKVSTIEELKAVIETFDGCLLKTMAENTVVGDGNCDADVMFISEVPEADEDRIGKVSIGKSGKLFDKMLLSIGLNKDNCYICNLLPWRPPGNRVPSESEIAICLPFLKKQIEIVKPAIIYAFGASVVNALSNNNESISKYRGKWIEYKLGNLNKIDMMVGYHPAYFLKNPKQKVKAWSDFLRLKKKIDENKNITC